MGAVASGARIAGSSQCSVAPQSELLVAHTRPPWVSTMLLHIARPSPMPCPFVVTKGSKTRSRSAGGIPSPRSVTQTSMSPAGGRSRLDEEVAVHLAIVHRITAVDDEIEEHLLQLDSIATHGLQIRRERGAHRDLAIEQIALHQSH